MILVPTRGFGAMLAANLAAPLANAVVGPFSVGDFIRRLYVGVSTDGVGVLGFAASLGFSVDASAEGLNAGIPLITSSASTISRTPGFRFDAGDVVVFSFVVAAGLAVTTGSMFLQIGVSSTDTALSRFNVSVEVVRVLDGMTDTDRERGRGPPFPPPGGP